MTVVLPRYPAWVLIALDTTAPTVDLHVPPVVQPPDLLVVDVFADEDLADASVVFRSSLGEVLPVGYEWLNPRHLKVILATVGISAGRGTLSVLVRDMAGNVGGGEHVVYVDRPRVFDAVADTLPGYEVVAAMSPSFEYETEHLAGFSTTASPDHAYETETEALSAFTTTTEVSDG